MPMPLLQKKKHATISVFTHHTHVVVALPYPFKKKQRFRKFPITGPKREETKTRDSKGGSADRAFVAAHKSHRQVWGEDSTQRAKSRRRGKKSG